MTVVLRVKKVFLDVVKLDGKVTKVNLELKDRLDLQACKDQKDKKESCPIQVSISVKIMHKLVDKEQYHL